MSWLSSATIQWASWADFATMGGYGLYVWGSFGVTALVLVLEVTMLRRKHRQLVQQVRHQPAEDE